jgi:hypothetical protein
MEEPLTRDNGIDGGFWGWGRNTIGSLNLEITFLNKEVPYGLDEACPLLKEFPTSGKDPVFHHRPILVMPHFGTEILYQDWVGLSGENLKQHI